MMVTDMAKRRKTPIDPTPVSPRTGIATGLILALALVTSAAFADDDTRFYTQCVRGDSVDKIKEFYRLSADPQKLPSIVDRTSYYLYHLEQSGIWVFFDETKQVSGMKFEAPFTGRVGDIGIGDTAGRVRLWRGEPLVEDYAFPETASHNIAWIYDPAIRYEFGQDDKVQTIRVGCSPGQAAAAPPSGERPVSPSSSADLVLTADDLTRMNAFWASFFTEPNAVRETARLQYRLKLPVDLGVAQPTFTVTDMGGMAAKFPSVAADFQHANLVPEQWERLQKALYQAFYSHLAHRKLEDPGAVVAQNIALLELHPAQAARLIENSMEFSVIKTESIELTTVSLRRMTVFWKNFFSEPTDIRDRATALHQMPLNLHVDRGAAGVQDVTVTVVDMEAMAAKFPSVDADFQRAGLTPGQWMQLRTILYTALLSNPEKITGPGAGNVIFVKLHTELINELKQAGMWFPTISTPQ